MFPTSSPTINISNDDSYIDKTDRVPNEYGSINILSDLPNSSNPEGQDGNRLPFSGFVEKAFFCLRQTTPPRYQCLKLLVWPWFDRICTFVILLNCITLGMYQPCAHHNGIDALGKCDTALCFWLEAADYFIFAFFTIEMCIKMIAMGIFGKGTYLADSWNRLDCFIVLTGFVHLLMPGDSLSLSAIRTVRLLRPLRTINRVPSMRILVMLLFDTLPMLGNVLLLCFLIFFIFGIIGVQLWKGLLRNRCFLQMNSTIIDNYTLFHDFKLQPFYTPPDEDSFICSDPSSSGMTKCSEIPKLRKNPMTCELGFPLVISSLPDKPIDGCINWNQYYRLCAPSVKNPFSGSISFDNIGFAWFAIFQIITFESWFSIMYYIQDAHSFWNWIYFVCLIVIGSLFMMNLCLVVICAQFSVTKKRETERMLVEQKRLSHSTSDQQGSCWEEIIKCCQQLSKRACNRFRILWKNSRQKRDEINQKHRPNSQHDQSQSLLVTSPLSKSINSGTATSDICLNIMTPTSEKNNRPKSENLEFEREEQQIERNDLYEDEIVNISDNNQDTEEEPSRRCENYCCSRYTIIQKLISRFVDSKYFDRIIFSAIIINTLLMAVEYHEQPPLLTNILEYSNYFFIILFTIEMLFKIIAHGCLKYVQSSFNVFDGGIILISLIELFGTKNSGLSVLRIFRLLREPKLLRFMPTLRRHLVVMIKTLDSVVPFLLLLILFMFIFSILGIHLFGGEFSTRTSRENFQIKCRCCACVEWNSLKSSTDFKDLTCVQARTNFDSLRFALLTVFQILTQQDLKEVLYNGIEKTSPWSALYFIALMILGNCILLNLPVAILVEAFANTTDADINSTDRSDKVDPFPTQAIITSSIQIPENLNESIRVKLSNEDRKNDRPQNALAGTVDRSFPSSSTRDFIIRDGNLIEQELNNTTNTRLNSIDNSSDLFNQNVPTSIYQTSREQEKNDKQTESNTNSTIPTQLPINDQNNMELDVSTENDTQLKLTTQKSEVIRSCLSRLCGQRIFECLQRRENYSFYLFSPSNRFRKVFQRLIAQKQFDLFILFFIALNCMAFAMERPSISPASFERQFLKYTYYICTAIFTIEMMIKLIASGLVFGHSTYLHTAWNVLDGFLVIISIVDIGMMHRGLITSSTQSDSRSYILNMLKVFRLLRTLQPLRVINRSPGLQLVIQILLSSLRSIGHMIIICCIFFIIFGILGIRLFKGKFYYCEGPFAHNVTTSAQCASMPDHLWRNHEYNFDNLGQALLALCMVLSSDGSVEIMRNGIDAVDVNMQPIRNYSEAKLIYFISFILIVGFFVLNMFVGVIIENFRSCRVKQELREKLKCAKTLEHNQHRIGKVAYSTHFSPWRSWLHDLCINKYFDLFIAAVIGLNVVTMSLEYYRMPSALDKFLEYCNYVFNIIFILEFILKIVALGPSRYFKEKWNQLDSFIVLLSIGDIGMGSMKNSSLFPIRVMRVLRTLRIFRLLKMAKGIRALLDIVIQALPQVGNLSLLFFLLFFIFGALGVQLFGKIECSEEQPCDGLNKHTHFKNFGMALLTLFLIATSDKSNGIMKDTLNQDDGEKYFMRIISLVYFIIFVLMAELIFVNIVAALLIKKLEDSNKMMAEGSEEIQRQLEPDIQDRNYVEQLSVDVNALHEKETFT